MASPVRTQPCGAHLGSSITQAIDITEPPQEQYCTIDEKDVKNHDLESQDVEDDSSPTPPKKVMPFFDLPGEIRNMIYRHCLVSKTYDKGDNGSPPRAVFNLSYDGLGRQLSLPHHHLAPNLLATCAAVRDEASFFLYSNRLVFPSSEALHFFLIKILPHTAARLRHIEVKDHRWERGYFAQERGELLFRWGFWDDILAPEGEWYRSPHNAHIPDVPRPNRRAIINVDDGFSCINELAAKGAVNLESFRFPYNACSWFIVLWFLDGVLPTPESWTSIRPKVVDKMAQLMLRQFYPWLEAVGRALGAPGVDAAIAALDLGESTWMNTIPSYALNSYSGPKTGRNSYCQEVVEQGKLMKVAIMEKFTTLVHERRALDVGSPSASRDLEAAQRYNKLIETIMEYC